jgi:NADH-quinone oxidoreductase subunit F
MSSESVHSHAVDSFFALAPGYPPGAPRVCRGLSCELNGAARLAECIGGGCETVYCLGYCDRSPALQLADGAVVWGATAAAWSGPVATEVIPVDIRAVSRRTIVTERVVLGSHSAFTKARQAGVYRALQRALEAAPRAVLECVEASGEQGRGGAGYPTGRKWRACAEAPGPRHVVANGDEGDPGSFIDRVLLEDDPHAVLEGLILCGFAVGANDGVIYIRAEYPHAQARMQQAIVEAREAGILGASVMGSGFGFEARVVAGRGSYVCGEETALLNAIEGRRGEVRVRPPYPAEVGLYGRPTVVNNIETLVNIPWLVREGAATYRGLGTADSPGTKAFCLSRGFARPGIVEAEFGVTLRALVEGYGGGARDPAGLAAVALGGPMGSVLTPEQWDLPVEYGALRQRGVRLGHGGIVAIPRMADLRQVLLNWVEFMAAESCGKCVPCGLGSRQALELVRRMLAGADPDGSGGTRFQSLMRSIERTSLCGFGQGIVEPILTVARLAGALPAAPGGRAGD